MNVVFVICLVAIVLVYAGIEIILHFRKKARNKRKESDKELQECLVESGEEWERVKCPEIEDSLTFKIRNRDPTSAVIELSGKIDTYNTNSLYKHASALIQTGVTNFTFDLTGITSVSSTGIGFFESSLLRMREMGGDIVLRNVNPRVAFSFRLVGYPGFIDNEAIIKELRDYLPDDLKYRIPPEKLEAFVELFKRIERSPHTEGKGAAYTALINVLRRMAEENEWGV